MAQTVKHLPTMWETWVQSLSWEDLMEKEMASHSSIVAWKTITYNNINSNTPIYMCVCKIYHGNGFVRSRKWSLLMYYCHSN